MNKRMALHIGMTCWSSQKAFTPTCAYDANGYTLNGLGQRISKTLPGNTTAGDANGDGTINAQDYSAVGWAE